MNEKVSALLDDELEHDHSVQALAEVSRDAELVDVWQRYHLIGAAFRKEPIHHNVELTQRIANVIQSENHPPPDHEAEGGWRAALSGWPTYAIAASLFLVTILAVQLMPNGESGLPTANTFVAASPVTQWEINRDVNEDVLNEFLIEHGEHTPAFGMNGLASYAKFVSYDTAE